MQTLILAGEVVAMDGKTTKGVFGVQPVKVVEHMVAPIGMSNSQMEIMRMSGLGRISTTF